MNTLLNRGLNFSVLPNKTDFTQLLVDCTKFERAAIWNEFWYGREGQETKEKPIFKEEKSNLPKNYKSPEDLKVFLSSVRSEISDPRNRNKEESNLPPHEQTALKELLRLQKEKKIVIKQCDKGAGIIILDYNEYMRACYSHLTSIQSDNQPYYTQVSQLDVLETQNKIERVIKEALENKVNTKKEYDAMNADNKEPGRFYCNFKVHKPHEQGKAPPE